MEGAAHLRSSAGKNGKATRSCHELLKNYLGSLQLPRVWAFPIKSHLNFKLVPSSRDCKKGSYFSLATPKLPGSKTQHKLTSNTQSIQQQRINLVSISNIQYRLSGQNNKIRRPTFILLFSWGKQLRCNCMPDNYLPSQCFINKAATSEISCLHFLVLQLWSASSLPQEIIWIEKTSILCLSL